MHSKSHISTVALAAALLTIPQAAQAQLNLGVDLGGNGSGGLGVGVDLGLGTSNVGIDAGVGGDSLVNVDAGVSTGSGGDSLVDADVGIGTSTDGGLEASALDVDLGVGRDDQLIDLDADLGGTEIIDVDVELGGGVSTGDTAPPVSSEPLVGVRVSALNQTARLDALVDLVNTPNLSDISLDDAIDDRAVSIVAVSELFSTDTIAEINALIETGGEGRQQLLAAIEASVELGSILDREGIAEEDVLAVYIGARGETEVLVLDAVIDLADRGDNTENSLVDTDLAELDIDLLTDDALAEIDLALLPDEEQRLDAIIRILDNGNAAPSGGSINSVQIIDISALLGEQSLAEVDAVLNSDGNDFVLTAGLLDLLDEQGLSPEAVVAIGSTQNGSTQLLVDLGLGDTALADVSVNLGGDSNGDDGDGGGDADPGSSDGTGSGGGSSGGSGGSGSAGTTGSSGSGGGSLVSSTGALTRSLPSGLMDINTVIAEVDCDAGIAALSTGTPIEPNDIGRVRSVELVEIEGCVQTLSQQQIAALRAAIEANAGLRASVENAGLDLQTLIGGNVEGAQLVLYFEATRNAA